MSEIKEHKDYNFLADVKFDSTESELTPKSRTLTGVAYAGGIVKDQSYYENLIIDVSGIQAKAPMPLLFNHDRECVVGMVDSVDLSSNQLSFKSTLFSDIDDEAAEIAAKADKGFPWQVSIGARPELVEFVESGVSVSVNGQDLTGPLTIFRNTRIREISVVALGADSDTSAKVFSATTTPKEPESISNQQNEETIVSDEKTNDTMAADLAAALVANEQLRVDLNAAQREVNTLKVELSALRPVKLEAEQLKAELAAVKTSTRTREVKDLFEFLGREYSDEAAQPYMSFSAEQFAVVESDLRATKPKVPDMLFSEQATDGATPVMPKLVNFSAPSGVQVDSKQASLHNKALQYQATHSGVSYVAAVAAVGG